MPEDARQAKALEIRLVEPKLWASDLYSESSMKNPRMRERLPIAVALGCVPVGALVAGATAFWFPQHALWVLLSVVVLGGLGIYCGNWPPIEYALVLIIMVVLAGLLVPLSQRFPLVLMSVGLPGAIAGYLWGGNCASILDKSNVVRITRASRDESADG